MVKITLHGEVGKAVGQKVWNLDVLSCSEAINAINVLTNNKLFNYLYKHGQDAFNVLINEDLFVPHGTWGVKDSNIDQKIKESELCLRSKSIKTIDIVPVITGGDEGTLGVIFGVLLIIVGVVLVATGVGGFLGGALIVGGIGVLAAGVINLLSKPPTFDEYREIEQKGGQSYLFNGPQNTIREGGPVPVGYGRLIVGSQVISASYDISSVAINEAIANAPYPAGLIAAFLMGNPTSYYYFGGQYSNFTVYYPGSVAGPNGIFIDFTGNGFYNGTQILNLNIRAPAAGAIIDNSGVGAVAKTVYERSIIFNNSAGQLNPLKIYLSLGTASANKIIQFKLHLVESRAGSASATYPRRYTITMNNGADIPLYSTGANTTFDVYVLSGNIGRKPWIKKGAVQLDSTGSVLFTFTPTVNNVPPDPSGETHNPQISAIEIFDNDPLTVIQGN